jgi:hypothetical protein
MEIVKYAKDELEYEKKILILIFSNVIIGAINGFYWYTVYDRYLEKTFKEEYTEWKENSEKVPEYEVRYEESKLNNIQEIQTVWSKFGPFAIIFSIVLSSLICSMVFCCYAKFRKSL